MILKQKLDGRSVKIPVKKNEDKFEIDVNFHADSIRENYKKKTKHAYVLHKDHYKFLTDHSVLLEQDS